MKAIHGEGMTKAQIQAEYDRLFAQRGVLRDADAFYRWVLGKLHMKPGQRLLDVACGEGVLLKLARQRNLNVIGIDLSWQGAHWAQEWLDDHWVAQANGENLPFADQSFDFVTNTGSLEHFQNPLVGITEMRRVLKPGGLAAILLPNSYYLVDIIWMVWRTGYSASHRQPLERFATCGEWRDLIEKGGLRVEKIHRYNYSFPITREDWGWYRDHPRRLLNLLVAPLIPLNLSYHFLFMCRR